MIDYQPHRHAVLTAVREGHGRVAAIAARTGLALHLVASLLDRLRELGAVVYRPPVPGYELTASGDAQTARWDALYGALAPTTTTTGPGAAAGRDIA